MARVGNIQKSVNRILHRLPKEEQELLARDVETVSLVPGESIYRAGKKIRHAYFPREGVVSLFASTQEGPEIGAGVVDAAGMFGLGIAARQSSSNLSATSQGHGSGDRISAPRFLELLALSASLREAMFVYAHQLSMQMAQNTACLSLHSAERRLARWMLDVTAASPGAGFSATQSGMAVYLGVQRPAVSRAASSLQQMGLIRYLRGVVSIVDRTGLSAAACTCSTRARNFRASA